MIFDHLDEECSANKRTVDGEMAKRLDLTISIVNTDNKALLEQCLRSIFENKHRVTFEVFVIDNASTDDSVQMVRQDFPQVKLRVNAEQLGFSANHNITLKQTTSRYVLILNDDTIILPNALDKMVEFMDTHPQAGLSGCKLLNTDGTLQPSCFKFYNLRSVFHDYCLVPRALSKNTGAGIYETEGLDKPVEVDWVLGACLILRDEAITEVGLLDDKLFAPVYSEEVDWCYRARQKGFKIYYAPDAQVVHYGGQTTKRHSAKMFVQLYRSRYLFFRKHYGRISAYILRVLISVTTLWNIAFLFFHFLLGRTGKKEFLARAGMYINTAMLPLGTET